MLPNALQPNETDHVPVLAEEVRELLAIEPGQTVVDATFGAGGHAAVLAADLKGDGRFIAIDRDPTVRPYFEGFKRHAGVQSRFLRGEASVVLDQLADNGVHADAILLDLGVSSMQIDRPGARFLVRGRRAARHAHGPDRRADRRRARQRGLGAGADHDLPQVRRRALREADRARDRTAAPQAADRAHRRPRGHHPRRDSRSGPIRRRPSGEARLPGAPHRRQRRARRARGGAAGCPRDAPTRAAASQ